MANIARVIVSIKKDILDPAGEALKKTLHRQGIDVPLVRIGKIIDVTLNDRQNVDDQVAHIRTAASEIFANPIMEDVHISFIDELDHDR